MKFEVRPSPIHGMGVFARQTIRRGERIGRYLSRKTNRDSRYVLWVDTLDGRWQGYKGYGRLRFLNHRSTPNSEFRGLDLYALRTIRAGEEITFHYGEEWEDVA
jgi:SET domain-containing protein